MTADVYPARPVMDDVAVNRSDREVRWLMVSVTMLALLRLWMMATHPLTDTTEARYGELARVTADGGFWLMPHMTPTEPFFAKPPLSTWLAAGSWKLLGPSEFALRLPSFLMGLLTVWFVLMMARDIGLGRLGRWMTLTMLATAPMFFVSIGAVMTDATQMAVATGAMVFAWRALRNPEHMRWRILFWSMLGIATLAKGLATLVLIGLPIVGYAVVGEGISILWRRLWDPWGLVVAAAICLAWYVPAELAYPGFLKYFLIGEHFQRYLQPGWAGDRYGFAHRTPFGMIWVFWLAGTGLWLPVFVQQACLLVQRDRIKPICLSDRWLWCWVLAPLVFFSLSRHILLPYTLTAIPPFAVIAGRWAETNRGWLRLATPTVAMAIALVSVGTGLIWLPAAIETWSARQLVNSARAELSGTRLVVRDRFPFSSSFYTRGEVRHVKDKAAFAEVLQEPGAVVLVSSVEAKVLRENHRLREIAGHERGSLFVVPRLTDSESD